MMNLSQSKRYEQAGALLKAVLSRAVKHLMPWDRKQAKIDAMQAILLSWAANIPECMESLKEHAKI